MRPNARGSREHGTELQRSRALSSAEIYPSDKFREPKQPLQRSRALSSAEILPRNSAGSRQRLASTEPRSFERGDLRRGAGNQSVGHGFNGAALFRARRCAMPFITPPVSRASFNGAALFRARRSPGAEDSEPQGGALQRSRALSSAEIVLLRLLPILSKWLQRSRALSSAEIV